MRLNDYLEMIPIREFRQKMADAGLNSNTSTTFVPADVPDWLIHDGGWYSDEIAKKELGPDIKKGLANHLGETIYNARQVPLTPLKKTTRAIVTIDGQVLWSYMQDSIHNEIVVYGMCTNAIPIKDELGDSGWIKSTDSINYFLAFEMGPEYIMLSESYHTNVENQIFKLLEDPRYKVYKNFIERLGFAIKDLTYE